MRTAGRKYTEESQEPDDFKNSVCWQHGHFDGKQSSCARYLTGSVTVGPSIVHTLHSLKKLFLNYDTVVNMQRLFRGHFNILRDAVVSSGNALES